MVTALWNRPGPRRLMKLQPQPLNLRATRFSITLPYVHVGEVGAEVTCMPRAEARIIVGRDATI